jgi:hypothetical protein
MTITALCLTLQGGQLDHPCESFASLLYQLQSGKNNATILVPLVLACEVWIISICIHVKGGRHEDTKRPVTHTCMMFSPYFGPKAK